MDIVAMREKVHAIYRQEQAQLGEGGLLDMLERGEQWSLGGTLSAGGALVFPHAGILDCGHQQAACVQAALDCGADTILVVSVLHTFTEETVAAQARVTAGGPASAEPLRGIQGPGISGARQEWRLDHAMVSWRFLWEAEMKRRGLSPQRAPRVLERYPFLAGGRPQDMPGYDELARLAEGAALVSTEDPHHHGVAYGMPREKVRDMDGAGMAYARAELEEGIALLCAGDYAAYEQHCERVFSDARDAGPVFHSLRPQLRGQILELVGSDASAYLPDAPPPNWVACALVDWR